MVVVCSFMPYKIAHSKGLQNNLSSICINFIRIQQIGIGVCDAETAKHTYKHLFEWMF
jgi:hypothetical protein